MPPRFAKKIDVNQPEIVEALLKIPGITVELDCNDILVGHNCKTYWFEIKAPDTVGKNGKIRESAIRPNQKELRATWKGHYRIVSSLDEILKDLGVICCD